MRLRSAPLSLALGLLVLVLAGPSATADSGKKFVWEGEELYYSVEVSGTEAARASLRAGKRRRARGATYVPIFAKAITHGFFAKSYPVNDNADTFVNLKDIRPLKADKDIREDGKNRSYAVRFDPKRHTANVVKTVRGKKRKYRRAIPRNTFDALSWMYHVRTMPMNDGDKYIHHVYDGWKLSKLHVTVVGREKVWTPMGYYETVKLDIEREVMNSRWNDAKKPEKGAKLSTRQKKYYLSTLHITDDARRIPVRVFMSGKMGDSDFRLIKYVPPGAGKKK